MVPQHTNELKSYLTLCRRLSKQANFPQPLLAYLEEQLEQPLLPYHWANFYKGEYAFYSEQYEQAVRHYLLAKDIPHFNFFCFRATAFLSKVLGRHQKAQEFAAKALAIYPNDETTLSLMESKRSEGEESAMPVIPIGEEEWKELNAIFSSVKEEPLFSFEN